MEVTDLIDSKVDSNTRSPLGIDLNEIPGSSSCVETLAYDSDSFDVVYNFHDNPLPPPGGPAGVPGEVRGLTCGSCGRPEVRGHVFVCDGCERGFHVGCVGMRGRQATSLEEWVCGECVSSGVKSKRWPLGVKSKQILDINASPPSDREGEGNDELQELRKHTLGDNSFGSNPFGAPATYSNVSHVGNGYGYQKACGYMAQAFRVGFQDILHHTQTVGRSLEKLDFGIPLGKIRDNKASRLPHRNPNEIFLQALRDFISEKHGVLGEGWHVEFKQSFSNCEMYAIYCAPDGKTFDSMSEVACYLGLMSNCSSVAPEIAKSASRQERLHLPKKRKSTKNSLANGFHKDSLLTDCYQMLSFEGQPMDICANKFENTATVSEAGGEENTGSASPQVNDGLPVQFEDFFVLSLGEVDARPSYHDVRLIWPVGYRSCWHDEITGSLFMCEVSDGGDSGPLFKVKRCSCSALPIPNGTTVLIMPNCGQIIGQTDGKSDNLTYQSKECDDDGGIEIFLLDSSPPSENDILSCLDGRLNQASEVQMSNSLQLEATFAYEESKLSSDDLGLTDAIGEILVEECSSSSAWRMMCQKIINSCSEIFKQQGTLRFFCKHVGNKTCSSYSGIMDEKSRATLTSLAKYFSSPGSVSIPSVIQSDSELNTLTNVLEKWLDQDRFGLDTEFVQEIIEQLPGVQSCSQYEYLSSRSDQSMAPMVGNGLLVVKTDGGIQGNKTEAVNCLFRRSKKAKLVEDSLMGNPFPPPGKPMGLSLPPQLVGDVYQVWELIWRFHEILGLKVPLKLEELEAELINPWSDGSNHLEKFEKEVQGSKVLDSHRNDVTGGKILSKRTESGSLASRENPHAFIQMETGAMKEAAQARRASSTYTRCTGVALTKAHKSLLRVVMKELQSKVAAFVDPNFDAGEPKSKRGRKKDTDSLIPAKSTKLNMLPINELTWPELARRYVLAILSMDGNFDSVEITARESVKVFRCLQGDGGMLCGSLTGVAAMEADAILLAEATKKIFSSLRRGSNVLTIEDQVSDTIGASERCTVNDGNIPEWAKLLEPVRKLPTNVGTRIRKCVYEALEKGPPEWAKKILEHSISKEVYKGNASGPTKKAVLSVLADVCGVGPVQKSDKGRKRKTVVSLSDIIMKQCRIVLRRAAAADDAKVFCNLLGRKLISCSDNDDEGLLGSPAMVSRPLDFRTIDLRLAFGAYGGSHEAFLEDVRELWNNVRAAFGDQQDFVELAETLSQNFESLYENEVAPLVEKFAEYAKSECLTDEYKKEINEYLASSRDLLKAPWDEGVCKVCGIDKDDDSVLLCDTCDAEYHTYCLNPPLARIPEGNWYCPSCVVSKCKVQDSLRGIQVTGRHRGRKYKGEVTHVYLEALTQLATVMEEKEYWEFNVEERTFLLKFLCDELLNSALIRQHLEQCAEASAELQQKLRFSSVDWRNLKIREEVLAARAARINASTVKEVSMKDGSTNAIANSANIGQPHTLRDSPNNFSVLSNDQLSTEIGREGTGLTALDKNPSVTCNSQIMDFVDTEGQLKEVNAVLDNIEESGNLLNHMPSQKDDEPYKPTELPLSKCLSQESNDLGREICFQSCVQECLGRDVSTVPSQDNVPQHGPAVSNESQAYLLIQKEILVLEESIKTTESQLLKLSVRREFLGSDSCGRMYWASAMPGKHTQVIVDGSMGVQQGGLNDHRNKVDDSLISEGSKAPCPYIYEPNNPRSFYSPWVSYQTDGEIDELIAWLKDNDPKERELKDSILLLQKTNFQHSLETKNNDNHMAMSVNSEKTTVSKSLVTNAAAMLEKKYGPCFESDTTDIFKKRGKKGRVTNEERMYRCECLEPIWPSRHHCLYCHKTFFTELELEMHTDGKCNFVPPTSEKSKEASDSLKGKVIVRSETPREECTGEKDMAENIKSGCFQLGSDLIKFQSEGLVCPFDLEEIKSKFVTRNSNKELVREIGLIGTNGVPTFVPSTSPYLSDPALMLTSSKNDDAVLGDAAKPVHRPVFSPGKWNLPNASHDGVSDNSSRTVNVNNEVLKNKGLALGRWDQRGKKASLNGYFSDMGASHCCVVPQSSLRPVVGKTSQIYRRLQINLLDMDAALAEEALRPSKSHLERRWAWRAFVKSAKTIYEMVQATIILEDMIKTEYLRNEWWYWSSLSAGAKTSTISSLALRIYSLDAAIIYDKTCSSSDPVDTFKPRSISGKKPQPSLDPIEKPKGNRKSNKKRKEPEV